MEELRRAWGVPGLRALDTTSSTSDVARRLAEAGAPHGSTVVADHQTAGRGRMGRAWSDRPGASLLLSMVLLPGALHASAEAAADAPDGGPPAVLPLLAGLACARAILDVGGPRVAIEWPNDLVVDDRKLGGILCESSLRAGTIDFVVVGVGINVGAVPDELGRELRGRVASLAECVAGRALDRVELAGAVARRLIGLRADSGFSADDLAELRRLDALAGRRVRLDTGREGLALGILPDGALEIDDAGRRTIIRAGSVSPVSPRVP